MQDESYAAFQRKLVPNIPGETVIGIRTPMLRKYAKSLFQCGEYEAFLRHLPHAYYEENNLHGMLIEQIRDFDHCVEELERFLPYVDNWATCDLLRPVSFKPNRKKLLPLIEKWIQSEHTYVIRFGMEMLMIHFLQEDYRPEYPDLVASVDSNEYYVNMMSAWYFATALAYQFEDAVQYLKWNKLSPWVHNKTIQKAVESFRISPEQKAYLRSLRRKGEKAQSLS